MLQNPVQLRLEKLEPWQHITFMTALCERMYPNYVLFCEQTEFADPMQMHLILDSLWESLTVKNAKVNFERQLERLEELVPAEDEHDIYLVYPALDACVALSHLLHGLLDRDILMESLVKISTLSAQTVADLEEAQTGSAVTNDNQKENEAVCGEWDVQWELFRVLRSAEKRDIEMIKGLRADLREEPISNIGVAL
ncbi:YjaG family protein [Thaumasiovibrio subtropicus]|uniref:YjaG family protein n=1 Tax=Thaumasiovibrio subtropicus TaxID=1891207 RepID=UPI000B36311E|nr:DUF416 family protein [Thaumasiovibrio subtropicus]